MERAPEDRRKCAGTAGRPTQELDWQAVFFTLPAPSCPSWTSAVTCPRSPEPVVLIVGGSVGWFYHVPIVISLAIVSHSRTGDIHTASCSVFHSSCRPLLSRSSTDHDTLPLGHRVEPRWSIKCTIEDVQEICSVCEKVLGVASEDRTDPGTYDFVPFEWSAGREGRSFLDCHGKRSSRSLR